MTETAATTRAADAAPDGRTVTVTREIAAPMARVWALFTEAEALMRWFGAEGFVNEEAEIDLRPGGHWHVASLRPDGSRGRVEGEILEIEAPRRMVQAWRAVGPDGVPGNETRAEIVLDALADGGTRVTVTHSAILRTPDLFVAGWTASLERMARMV